MEVTFISETSPDSPYSIEWLHGPAGAGKSSILRTIAQLLHESGLLLGSFFFFRASGNRNRSKYVISTLAYQPDQDIRKYLVDKFDANRQSHSLEFPSDMVWPSPGVIDTLVVKASGQFIYASTVVKFVCSPRHNPVERLDIILGAISAGKQKPFEQLDSLYSTIFQAVDGDHLAPALRILGFLLIPRLRMLPEHPRGYQTHSPAYLEFFLQLQAGDVRRSLFDLESLLTLHGNDENIQFFHASLSDFLLDLSRSGPFWIDSGLIYADIAQHCIIHLPSWPRVQDFLVENGDLFSRRAKSTPEFRQAIKSCDLEEVIARPSKSRLACIKHLCPTVLQITSKNSAEKAFQKKLLQFQGIVAAKIAVYFRNIYLKSFLVTSTLAYTQGNNRYKHYDFLLHPEAKGVEEKEGFSLCTEADFTPISWVLELWLNDPKGVYFIDEVQYTDITLHLMQYSSRPFPTYQLVLWHPYMHVLNDISPFLFSKSLVHSDLVNETKKILLRPPQSLQSETCSAMEAYILRAGKDTKP